MPHNPDDIGVNINDYLGALGRYNLQYGGNQGNQVISSTTAPGYAYQNPQTQETYPLYPEGTEPQGPPQGGGFSGGEGRFHDYLQSVGAKQQSIGYGHAGDPGGARVKHYFDNERGELLYGTGQGWMSAYELTRNSPPQAQYSLGETTRAGVGAQPGYVDEKGGFLGYGGTPDELFANSNPLLQRQYYESLYR